MPSTPIAHALSQCDAEPTILLKVQRYFEEQKLNTAEEVVRKFLSAKDIARGCGCSIEEAQNILTDIGLATTLMCVGLSDTEYTTPASLGCPVLNKFLDGGFPVGQLTELAGPAGVGKTQILLQTAIYSILPTVSKELSYSVYIATEMFPATRMNQLCTIVHNRYPAVVGSAKELLSRVLVSSRRIKETPWEHLQRAVSDLTRLSDTHSISCVVIDSVAAGCCDFAGEAMVRAPHLSWLASELKRIASTNSIPIITSNHVVADFSSHVEGAVKPALGTLWSHLVNTRLIISRSADSQNSTRQISITSSPSLPKQLYMNHNMERTKRPYRGGWNRIINPASKCYKATRNREPYGPSLEERQKRMRTAVGEISFNTHNEVLERIEFEFAFPPVEAYPEGWFEKSSTNVEEISECEELYKSSPCRSLDVDMSGVKSNCLTAESGRPTPVEGSAMQTSPFIPTPVRRLTFSLPHASPDHQSLGNASLPPIPPKSTKAIQKTPIPVTPFQFTDPSSNVANTTGCINNSLPKKLLTVRNTLTSRIRSQSAMKPVVVKPTVHSKVANYKHVTSKVRSFTAAEAKRERKPMSPIDAPHQNVQQTVPCVDKKQNPSSVFTFAKASADSDRARAVEKARRQAVMRSRAFCEKRERKHVLKQTLANPRWHW